MSTPTKPSRTTTNRREAALVPWVWQEAEEQRRYFTLPPICRATVLYATPNTVRMRFDDAPRPVSRSTHQVYCLPDEAAWEHIQALHAAFQTALDRLADALRPLRYHDVLNAQGGVKHAPNPLCAEVFSANEDPDRYHGNWSLRAFEGTPSVHVVPVTHHTPKMLDTGYRHHQDLHFVCPDEVTKAQVLGLQQAVKDAQAALLAERGHRGTYQQARADGRYGARHTS